MTSIKSVCIVPTHLTIQNIKVGSEGPEPAKGRLGLQETLRRRMVYVADCLYGDCDSTDTWRTRQA